MTKNQAKYVPLQHYAQKFQARFNFMDILYYHNISPIIVALQLVLSISLYARARSQYSL